MKQFLEAGEITNTHGIHGELKILPWCDSPEFLLPIQTLYIDERPFRVIHSRIHKNFVLVTLEGIDTMELAIALKRKIVFIDRNDVQLSQHSYFLQDVIHFTVFDARLEREIGKIEEILNLPASNVYVIRDENGSEILIPAVPQFIQKVDFEHETVYVSTIDGMC